MTRTRTVLLVSAAVLAFAGCGGSGDASRSDVQDDVEDILLERGLGDREFSATEAEDTAQCVAAEIFDSNEFSSDERNDIAKASDGEAPDEALVTRVIDLVDGCVGEATTAGPDAPDEETDTTDGDG